MGDGVERAVARVRALVGEDPFTHELRFLLTPGEATRFLDSLGERARVTTYDPDRPICYTRTTYFDTADAGYLSGAPDQPARRLRVRQYAVAGASDEPPVFSGAGFIELKQHLGAARSKVRLAASPRELARLLDDPRRALARAGGAADPLALLARELSTPTMAPRLSTWYRRLCLGVVGAPVRVTLDEGLQFCAPQPLGRAGLHAAPPARDVVAAFPARVLEIKHADALPPWLLRLLEGFRPAPQRFSKYRLGMQALAREQALQPRPAPRAAKRRMVWVLGLSAIGAA
jgi:hypothetical protein